jgi:small conductance mechanosensitive channel
MAAPADDPLTQASAPVSNMWTDFVDALPRLGLALFIVVLGWAVGRVVRILVRRALVAGRTPSFAQVMSKLAGWVVVFLALLVASAVTFPSVKPVDLLAGLGFFSVAIGFAFQDILENTLSGVLLLFRQPFRSGDQIEVQDRQGRVEAITIRETRLRTFDGQLIVIPNRDVYKSVIRVQTHYPNRRLAFTVGIAYENDPAEAAAVIVEAMRGVEGVDPDPAPEALVRQLGVSTVDIEARLWTGPDQQESLIVLHRAIVAVKAALDRAGIEMPAGIVALQATPSFKAAIQGDGEPTPGGGLAGPGRRS